MYKLTFYDHNLDPVCDGTTFWFVEDLHDFEQHWLPLQAYHPETVEYYYKSKLGIITIDYWSTNPDLNIVQECETCNSDIFEYEMKNKIVRLCNFYRYETTYHFDRLIIKLMIVKFKDNYYLTGQYYGEGCKRIQKMWNHWYNKYTKYQEMGFYGNHVAIYDRRYINWEDRHKHDAYKDFCTNDKSFFKDDTIETFVWLPIKKVRRDYKVKELSSKELHRLLRDIVGRAG